MRTVGGITRHALERLTRICSVRPSIRPSIRVIFRFSALCVWCCVSFIVTVQSFVCETNKHLKSMFPPHPRRSIRPAIHVIIRFAALNVVLCEHLLCCVSFIVTVQSFLCETNDHLERSDCKVHISPAPSSVHPLRGPPAGPS